MSLHVYLGKHVLCLGILTEHENICMGISTGIISPSPNDAQESPKNDDSEIIERVSITYLPPSGQVCDSGCLRLISAFSTLLARNLKSPATCLLDRVGESSTKELRSQISLLSIEFGFLIL